MIIKLISHRFFFKTSVLIMSVMLFCSCKNLSQIKRHKQFYYQPEYTIIGSDSLLITLNNPLKCPLRFYISANNEELNNCFSSSPFLAEPLETIYAKVPIIKSEDHTKSLLQYNAVLGSEKHLNIDSDYIYAYPFPKNKKYKIIQGHNGKLSHNTDYSRYAIDFKMPIKDTVCAVRDGLVVGVVNDYNISGKSKKYRDFANYITLYHSDGTFTQYVHLTYNSAMVKLGDTVRQGQPIALSGNTGFSTTPHLHFNSLKPTEKGIVSYPIVFENEK